MFYYFDLILTIFGVFNGIFKAIKSIKKNTLAYQINEDPEVR